MSDFNNRSQSSARRGDYVWQYEYYDEEEPVSFEGLKAHRCKLVTTAFIKKLFTAFHFFLQYVCVRAFSLHACHVCVSKLLTFTTVNYYQL